MHNTIARSAGWIGDGRGEGVSSAEERKPTESLTIAVRSTTLFKLKIRNWTRLVQKPNWTRVRGKSEMCTPVHGLSGVSAIELT